MEFCHSYLFVSLYGGQFTLSTPLIKPNFCILLPHRRSSTVSLETTPSYFRYSLIAIILHSALSLAKCFKLSNESAECNTIVIKL